MSAFLSHLTLAGQFFSDPWKVGVVGFIAYVIAASLTLNVRAVSPQICGFRELTPPLGGWMLFPTAILIFPVLGFFSAAFAAYLLGKLWTGHFLARQEWAQLIAFLVAVPMCISCTISFFRWCVIRRRYDEAGLEWGVLKYSHRIEWSEIASYRVGESRGLRLRLRNGSKLNLPVYLNGLSELAQKVESLPAVNSA